LEVEPEGPVIDVGGVEGDSFLEVFDAVAAGDLPEAGEAGFDAEAAALGVFFDAFDFVDREGARADEAHFASEDVEELGEFVDAEAPEPGTEVEDAGVVAGFEDGAVHFVMGGEFFAHGVRRGCRRWAGDGGLEEVGGDPGFDAFGFAGLDGFFDAGEVDVLGGEEDAADGMLMHGGNEGFDRVLGEVDAGADVDFGAVFVVHPKNGNG